MVSSTLGVIVNIISVIYTYTYIYIYYLFYSKINNILHSTHGIERS